MFQMWRENIFVYGLKNFSLSAYKNHRLKYYVHLGEGKHH